MVRRTLLAAAPVFAEAHFGLLSPATWTDPQGQFVSSNDWSSAGCGDTPDVPEDVEKKPEGCLPEWYTNNTFLPEGLEPTLPDALRTYKACGQGRDGNNVASDANCLAHPWAAPGMAPIFSPCGVDGGNAEGCPAGNAGRDGCAAGGYGHGPDARDFYQDHERFVTEWQAGAEVEVKWAILANHGGGYSFRLCPKPKVLAELTEECFQRGSLEFVGNTSWAVYDGDERTAFPSYSVSLATGHWRQNPVPACGDATGGAILGLCTKPYQFPPRVNRSSGGLFHRTESLAGFSGSAGIGGLPSTQPLRKWAIVDRVRVPQDLAPGDYVLSYRFDCEQTSQVWNMCSDIKIVDGAISV